MKYLIFLPDRVGSGLLEHTIEADDVELREQGSGDYETHWLQFSNDGEIVAMFRASHTVGFIATEDGMAVELQPAGDAATVGGEMATVALAEETGATSQ